MSNDNIRLFPFGVIQPDILLEKAKGWDLQQAVIIGFDSNNELVFGGTEDNWKDLLFLMYQANEHMRNRIFAEQEGDT